MQGLGLCTGMLAWVPGYAAAGVIALISPLFLAVLPILAPVSNLSACLHLCLTALAFPERRRSFADALSSKIQRIT